MARRLGLLGIDGATSTAHSQEGSLASTVSKRSSLSPQSNQSSSAFHRILSLLGRPLLMMGAAPPCPSWPTPDCSQQAGGTGMDMLAVVAFGTRFLLCVQGKLHRSIC